MKRLREKEISSLAETKNGNNSLPSLPEELIIIILSLLPVKSIMRFTCVCKLWLERFKNPNFINMHLNQAIENNRYNVYLTTLLPYSFEPSPPYYRLDFDEASVSSLSDKAVKIDLPLLCSLPAGTYMATCRKFLGSCNGIFCFSREVCDHSVIVSLCNPSTQEYKDIVYKKPDHGDVVAYGFGYESKINDYKLILIFSEQQKFKNYDEYSDKFSEIHVYTLGSDSWKIIGNTKYAVRIVCHMYSMKPLNGVMHWVGKKLIVTDEQETVNTVILSLDISEERTKEIQIPSCLLDGRCKFRNERVGVLGKDLYFSAHVSDVFELWVMKDYGVADSWIKLLSIPEKMEKMKLLNAPEEMEEIYIWEMLVLCNNNREIIFNCSYYRGRLYNALVSYDLRNGRLTFLNICDTPVMFTAEPFIECLVSVASSK